ncbi:Uncharacterised protein [Mycobacteroides abscessus subsp. abscessus]|nr:Uncharacterised protein [Mycobacteroides abscessus subsp. abscessus]SLJ73578.1 Uncharacterised protein [Mycobacteroides abscessus subsp. abscessus]
MGTITSPASTLAAIEAMLTLPEIAAITGAVTSWAATATHSASASGLGQPRAVRRIDQRGANTTRAAVATTDNAKPMSTASPGDTARRTKIVAAKAGMA